MKQIFVNVSNHPSSKWGDAQLSAAKSLVDGGKVIDLAFPQVDPSATSEDIKKLSEEILTQVDWLHVSEDATPVVHIMGEMTLVFSVVTELKKWGVQTVASTTIREVIEKDNIKTSVFKFCKFRQY